MVRIPPKFRRPGKLSQKVKNVCFLGEIYLILLFGEHIQQKIAFGNGP